MSVLTARLKPLYFIKHVKFILLEPDYYKNVMTEDEADLMNTKVKFLTEEIEITWLKLWIDRAIIELQFTFHGKPIKVSHVNIFPTGDPYNDVDTRNVDKMIFDKLKSHIELLRNLEIAKWVWSGLGDKVSFQDWKENGEKYYRGRLAGKKYGF